MGQNRQRRAITNHDVSWLPGKKLTPLSEEAVGRKEGGPWRRESQEFGGWPSAEVVSNVAPLRAGEEAPKEGGVGSASTFTGHAGSKVTTVTLNSNCSPPHERKKTTDGGRAAGLWLTDHRFKSRSARPCVKVS